MNDSYIKNSLNKALCNLGYSIKEYYQDNQLLCFYVSVPTLNVANHISRQVDYFLKTYNWYVVKTLKTKDGYRIDARPQMQIA